MLMQALFSREGQPIHHSINGFQYVFKANEHGDFVTNVYSQEHRDMMIKSGNFKLYEEPLVLETDMNVDDEIDSLIESKGEELETEIDDKIDIKTEKQVEDKIEDKKNKKSNKKAK